MPRSARLREGQESGRRAQGHTANREFEGSRRGAQNPLRPESPHLMAPARIVLRMQRDLTAPFPEAAPPPGIRIRTLNAANNKDAKAAHAVLAAGYYEGGGGAAKFSKWWREL